MAGSLEGLVVLDLTSNLAGPYAAMMLAGGRPVEGNRSKSGKDKPARARAKSPAKKRN